MPWIDNVLNKMQDNRNQPKPQLLNSNSFIALSSSGLDKANSLHLDGDLGEIISLLSSDKVMQIRELANTTGLSEKHIIELVKTSRLYFQVKSPE